MIRNLLENMKNLALSMPTNMVILAVICLVLKLFFRYTWTDCIKVIIGYLLLCVLLGFFGFTMPSFITIFYWCKAIFMQIWQIIW